VKRLVCRVLFCPFVGHRPRSQFASAMCFDCGALITSWRRVRPMRFR
jgi:hypothetical protein